jgi:hypothetical protein
VPVALAGVRTTASSNPSIDQHVPLRPLIFLTGS